MLAFVPGAVSPANGVDSGGSKGEQSVRISVFGARPNDQRQMTNGLMYTNLNGDGGGRLYFVNPVTIQENVIDLGAAGSASVSDERRGREHDSAGRRQPVLGHRVRRLHQSQPAGEQPERRSQGLGPDGRQRRPQDLRRERTLRRAARQGQVVVRDVRAVEAAANCARRACSTTRTSNRLDLHARYQPAGRSGGTQPQLSRSGRRSSSGRRTSSAPPPTSSATIATRRSVSSIRASRASKPTRRCATTIR